METQIEQLGKVCFTIDKNYHDINRDYDKLVIVESYDDRATYASRKPVPAGTPLTDREYWIKFSSLKEHIQQNYNVIQQELNALYDKVGVGITFSGDYSTFDVGKSKTITLSFATVNAAEKASVVKLYQSNTLMDTYNNISEFTKEVTVSDEVTFRVVATIGNYTYSATWEVTRAYDWYIGGGATHEAVMIDTNKHSGTDESISSIQSVNVNHSGDHIFICVQKDVFLPEVTMNGFTVPFDAPYTAIVDDIEYNVYKSSNAYTVNTYVLKIDAANWNEDEIFRNLISVVTGFDSETEDLQNRMETAEAVYLRHTREISSIIDRIDPLIERTGGSGEDAQPMRRAPSPWDNYRGMKHIQLLPKEEEGAVLTQEDFAEENAIYVIQYDFTIDENITIPANCVLEFDGGSISASGNNYTITGSNTGIKAELIKIFNVDITLNGSWTLKYFYPNWFGAVPGIETIDNSIFINKVASLGFVVYIPAGTYHCKTPIVITNATGFECAGKLMYEGNNVANTVFITFVESNVCTINIKGSIELDESVVDYTSENNTNIVGLKFYNCNGMTVNINEVCCFNTGIQLIGDNAGCCYNSFRLGEIINTNKAIHITWGITSPYGGWCNENTFIHGRLVAYSNFFSEGYDNYGIYIEKTPNAAYGGIDALRVKDISMEGRGAAGGHKYPIRIIGTSLDCVFENIRTEGCKGLIEVKNSENTYNLRHSSVAGPNNLVETSDYNIYAIGSTFDSFRIRIPIGTVKSTDTNKTFNVKGYDCVALLAPNSGTRYSVTFKKMLVNDEEVSIDPANMYTLFKDQPLTYQSSGGGLSQAGWVSGEVYEINYIRIPDNVTEAEINVFAIEDANADVTIMGLKYNYHDRNWVIPQ